MAKTAFDRKFGEDMLAGVASGPGVYLLRDGQDRVIYVGKAKNLRRRLQSYRNASAKRLHRKMRKLVREAARIEVRNEVSEEAALLSENALIQALRPKYNVDGAFAFLYPAVGLRASRRQTLLAFSTDPQAWSALGLTWYGVFRSRLRAKEGFDALVELLSLLGHRERKAQLPAYAPRRGARLVGIRQLPATTLQALDNCLAGRDRRLLGLLATELLAKPRARREAGSVQSNLHLADRFFRHDCVRLCDTLHAIEHEGTFIAQAQRDAAFIRARAKRARSGD